MQTNNLNEGGAKFRDRVSKPSMFRAYMLVKQPVLGVTGAHIENIGSDGCAILMPWGRGTKSLFGTMFGAAVVAAAETVTSALLVLHIRNESANLTAELVKMELEQFKAAWETVRVTCIEGALARDLVRSAARDGQAEGSLEVRVLTDLGLLTHRLRITWRLVPK